MFIVLVVVLSPKGLLVIWGTEKVSSLTFEGTQNNNMSDEGAKEQQQGGFYCFCLNHTAYSN